MEIEAFNIAGWHLIAQNAQVQTREKVPPTVTLISFRSVH